MTESRIPEEIIREILECAIWPHSSDYWFSESERIGDQELGGPLFAYSRPQINVLATCKRWLRVATPIFYRYILLSTQEQVRGLADVLRKHPDIARVVRHVRLEGGYGRELETILRLVPNIQTVSVNVFTPADGKTAGIVRGLSHVNPTRLYLHGDRPCELSYRPDNKPTRAIRQAVFDHMKRWKRLERVYIAESFAPDRHNKARFDISTALTKGLAACDSLEVISISVSEDPVCWKHLRAHPRLRAIHCRSTDRYFKKLQTGKYWFFEEMRPLLVHKRTIDVVYDPFQAELDALEDLEDGTT